MGTAVEVNNAPIEEAREDLDDKTLQLAFDEAVRLDAGTSGWADALDRKLVAIFSVGTLVFGLAPNLPGLKQGGLVTALFLLAGGFWLISAGYVLRAFRVTGYRRTPDPDTLRGEAWLSLSSANYRVHRLRELGRSVNANWNVLTQKAKWVQRGLYWTAAEVFVLAVAFVLDRT
jgi:hypothetical protein